MSLKALVLDDDPVMLALLQKHLEARGYQVMAYSNPAICPQFTARACPCTPSKPCPDIMIADLVMSTVNGIQFYEELKRKACRCKNIALISGLWTESSLKWAAEAGVKVLNKPIGPDQLNGWLTEVVSRTDKP
jgi:CheY-like chemotaxis protein